MSGECQRAVLHAKVLAGRVCVRGSRKLRADMTPGPAAVRCSAGDDLRRLPRQSPIFAWRTASVRGEGRSAVGATCVPGRGIEDGRESGG